MASKSQKFIYALQAEYHGKSEMAQLSSDLKAMGQIKSFEGLQADFAATTTALTEAKNRMRELKKQMQSPGGEAFTAAYQASVAEVNNLGRALDVQKAKMGDTRKAMQDQGFEMGSLSQKYGELEKSTQAHGARIGAMKTLGVQSFASIEQEVQKLHSAYKILEQDPSLSAKELAVARRKMEGDIDALRGKTRLLAGEFGEVKSNLLGLGAVAGVGAYGLTTMMVNVGENAKQLKNLSQQAGMTTEEMSAMSFATNSVGIDMEQLSDMSKDVKDKLGEFIATGEGEFKEFFENIASQVGLTAQELQNLSGPEVLQAVKDALDAVNVSAEEEVYYFESIANDVSKLIPLLQDSGKAMKEKTERAKELGLTISEMDNAKLVEMAEKTYEVQRAGQMLSNEIIGTLAPSLHWLMGLIQQGIAWFNNLDPAMQKIIVGGVALTAAVVAIGAAFFPVIASVSMGLPLFSGLGGAAASAAKGLFTMAGGMTALGTATKAAGLIGLAVMVFQIGYAFGTWLSKFDVVETGMIKLMQVCHLLYLNIRRLWNVLTGDDKEVAELEKRIDTAKGIYADMLADVGKKQGEQVTTVAKSQEKVTAKIEAEAKNQVKITADAVEKIKASYASVGGVEPDGKAKTDEFGRTEADIANRKKNEDIKRARKSGDMTGFKKVKNADGTVQWDYDDSPEAQAKAKAKEEAKTPTKVYGADGKWQYHYGDRSGLTKIAEDKYTKTANNINARVGSASAGLDKAVASKQSSETKKTVELKLGSAKLNGDQAGVDAFIEELKRAGMAAA